MTIHQEYKNLNDLEIATPNTIEATEYSDPKKAVEALCEIYDQATEFLRTEFERALNRGSTDVRYRAYYPEIRLTTTSHTRVDSRLAFGYVHGPVIIMQL